MYGGRTEVIKFEGLDILVNESRHARERGEEREITFGYVLMMLEDAIEDILDLKNGTEFAVVNANRVVVASINSVCGELSVDIKTVIFSDSYCVYHRKELEVIYI